MIADAVFGRKYPIGRYVDIGCFDPQKWSNTYRFYLKGWSGLGVDPNSEFSENWRKHRPRDVYLNVAVSDETGVRHYTKYDTYPQENRLGIEQGYGDRESVLKKVRVDRLDRLLAEYHPADQNIDLMSIDCEGHDLRVLLSNDFDYFRPRVLIVEDYKQNARSEVDVFCESKQYRLVGLTVKSKVFIDTQWRRKRTLDS